MANTIAADAMFALLDQVAETTEINMTLSKNLETWDMDSSTNNGENVESSGNGADVEWIPQEYRFTVQDGIVSSASDFQDLTDRLIPVRRNKAKRVLTTVSTKGLRQDRILENARKGMAKDIANAVDVYAYDQMIRYANMNITTASDFDYTSAIDAETLMLNRGLGAYDKELFLSNDDYAKVAKDLGANQYYGREGTPADALERARIPDLATFKTMRSDYLRKLAGNATTGLTVNGDQSHTVATYDTDEFFLDNRQMTLAITGATTANFPASTKFTIAGVNALHPETREDTGELQTFTVLTAGTGSAVISPAIVINGPYANCSAQAADTSAITILNIADKGPSLFYTPESTVIIPGILPVMADAGVSVASAATPSGLPLRMTWQWNMHEERLEIKTLIFFDVQVIHPNMVGTILANQS